MPEPEATYVEFEDANGDTWRLVDDTNWIAENILDIDREEADRERQVVLDIPQPLTNVRRGDRTFDAEVFLSTAREALAAGSGGSGE